MSNNTGTEKNSKTERTLRSLANVDKAPKYGLVIFILLYLVGSVFTIISSHSDQIIMFMGQPMPVRLWTGAFSSLANICILLIVLFYGDFGFILSITVLLCQFPVLLLQMFMSHNFSIVTGLFSNTLVIITIIIIYRSNIKIKKYQLKLQDQAVSDRLTGLPNRFACSELMADLVRHNIKFTLALVNLNNFRNINYTMGQGTGNAVLVKIANRWKDIADNGMSGTNDFITCQGGDEFAIIIRDYKSEDDVIKTLKYYSESIKNNISVDGCDYFITADIGYAEYPVDARSGDNLIACANAALADVKRKQEDNRIRHFTTEILDSDRTLEIERKILSAIENDTLYCDLQPQYDMNHKLSGFEALARLKDQDGNIIGPVEFIPVAEKVGLVDKIDYIVFMKSACFFGELIRKTNTDITLSVNVSVRHLMKNDFMNEVRTILSASGVPANQIEIEITESIMIDSMDRAVQCISEIKKMGLKVAIDDFGTGYSSLSYLNSFPADMLKVDKEFIDKMNTNETSRKYIAAIISIGHVMNFDVISEGVEKEDQLDTLRDIGCDYIQGFIWGRPMSEEDAAKLVEESVKEQK